MFYRLIHRNADLQKVRSLSGDSVLDDLRNYQDSIFEDKDSVLDYGEKESVERLKQEIKEMKSELKYLKRLMVIYTFGSKEQFKDFFSDIW